MRPALCISGAIQKMAWPIEADLFAVLFTLPATA
jgi:hypothetical protein